MSDVSVIDMGRRFEDAGVAALLFTDIGRDGLAIIRDPEPPTGGADVILCESTYGDRDHESVDDAREHLGRVVRETAARGGRLLIPAFAVGRTQELVYDLHGLLQEGKIPPIPIAIDSPLAIDVTTVFGMHPDTFDQSEALVRRDIDLIYLIRYLNQ